jgi:geranylgeranyl pyrophosphate synthase
LSGPVRRVYELIQATWQASELDAEFVEAMSRALSPSRSAGVPNEAPTVSWVLLPCWCCQSAGGAFRSAEPLAAAWGLLYAASHILDQIEDGDVEGPFGPSSATSQMLNASTGLIVSASLMMHQLSQRGVPTPLVGLLAADLHHTVLGICGGQHLDLVQEEVSLETAWQIAERKTGAFFALACRAGARLATDDADRLAAYGRFGHHLGLLLQISDDWSDLRPSEGKSDLARGVRSTLPVAYALSVLPPDVCARLRAALSQAPASPDAEAEAQALIASAGAELYLTTEALRHRRQAALALEQAGPPSAARDALGDLLGQGTVF